MNDVPDVFRVVVDGEVVRLAGEFDRSCITQFEAAIASLRFTARTVHVELSEVELIDSAAIGALLRLRRDVEAAGGGLIVAAPRPFQQRLFRITGLEHLLDGIDGRGLRASGRDADGAGRA